MNPVYSKSFVLIVEENKRRINYHMERLYVSQDNYHIFYKEGLEVLFEAYSSYYPGSGSFESYIDFFICRRFIHMIKSGSTTHGYDRQLYD